MKHLKSLLIIEDNEHILKAHAEYFSLCDYEVFEASALEQAWEELSRHAPDLIILDNELPDGHGVDFFKRTSADIGYPCNYDLCRGRNQWRKRSTPMRRGRISSQTLCHGGSA
jgi:DNA-binding NtrC family response regulator